MRSLPCQSPCSTSTGTTVHSTGGSSSRQHCSRARQRRRPAALPAQQPAAVLADQEAALVAWITSHGGYVHPSLHLVDHAPCSARGVVAAVAIAEADLEAGPLISIPQALHLSNSYGCNLLLRLGVPMAVVEALTSTQLVVLALLHERSMGATSTWQPYLSLLPDQPPNPWLLPSRSQLQDCAAMHCTRSAADVPLWVAAAQQEHEQRLAEAQHMLQLLGSSRRTALVDATEADVLWAMGMVASRSLTSGAQSGLLPYIDLLNHSDAGSPPMLQLDDSDALVMTVLPIRDGVAHGLAEGEELYIRYAGGFEPLEAFLKFGFVSDGMWSNSSQS